MIVIDSSALCSITLQKPDNKKIARTIDASTLCWISAANYFETAVVLQPRLQDGGRKVFDDLIREAQIETVPVGLVVAERARKTFLHYGKGRHKAALNLCGCIAYATAKLRDAPLLAKGGDFQQTDVLLAD